MKRYRVILNGQNFKMGNGDVFGFYTTCWIKAKNTNQAEILAVELIQQDASLQEIMQNENDEPPIINLEGIEEVGWFEFFRKSPGNGYTFYPNDNE